LDMFPEWGDPLPLWDQTDSVDRDVSDELEKDLVAWNREWESAADAGSRVADGEAWIQRGEQLAERVETETGAIVVVLGPERFGPAAGCPRCGPRSE
jgi:hypothetical protein